MSKKDEIEDFKEKTPASVLLISKTLDEEKLGGPYKWARELLKSLEEKNYPITNIRLNWKSIFKKEFLRALKEIYKNKVIHVYVSNLGIVLATIFAKIMKKRIIYTCHGNFYKEGEKNKWLFVKYYLLAKMATELTFPSDYIRKMIVKKINKPFAITYCSSKLETKTKKKGYKKYTFLQVTGFHHYKKGIGILPLTKAFKKFNSIYPDSRLVIIGGGQFLEEIKAKTGGKNINFLGAQPPNKVATYMKTCDCFMHITNLDNLPLTILEATSFNKPIIASNKFGIPEISKDIYLTKNTIKDILERMLEVYEKKEKKKEYHNIKKFDKDCSTNQMINIYKKI